MIILAGLVIALNVAVWKLSSPQSLQQPKERPIANQNSQPEPAAQQPHIIIETQNNPSVLTVTKSPAEARQEQQDREREATTQWWSIRTGWIMAALTAVLIGLGVLQYRIYNAQLATTQEIERAYIKMAHSPNPPAPGDNPNGGRLHFLRHPDNSPTTDVWFKYGIKNRGRTPCNVLGGGVWHVTSNDPVQAPQWTTPDTPPIRVDPTFLVPDMAVFDKRALTLDADLVEKIRVGAGRYLWLIGYVDYRDRFQRVHRAGYGRFYDHIAMDLVFDQTTAAMNYDRELSPEERQKYESQ